MSKSVKMWAIWDEVELDLRTVRETEAQSWAVLDAVTERAIKFFKGHGCRAVRVTVTVDEMEEEA